MKLYIYNPSCTAVGQLPRWLKMYATQSHISSHKGESDSNRWGYNNEVLKVSIKHWQESETFSLETSKKQILYQRTSIITQQENNLHVYINQLIKMLITLLTGTGLVDKTE